ncbi:response regulator [Paenibacillus sp. MBLB4367]|uniref:response regulator n=1 Tax=Paenibacillus sp. MBLB4367 TaxID=3384767 RepID=UPI0039080B36
MNVLIVDDQRLSRAGIVKMIEWERLGLTLAGECANGREALERIGDVEADIVITDVRMPVMSGLELIEKAKEQYPGLSYVVISGYDDYQYVRKSIQLTVADYLLKPVDSQELNALLEKLVGRMAEQNRQAKADLRKWREQFFHFLIEGVYEQDEAQLLEAFAEIRFAGADDSFVSAVFESALDKQAVYEALRPLEQRMAVCVLRTRGVYVLLAAGSSLTADEVAEALWRQAAAAASVETRDADGGQAMASANGDGAEPPAPQAQALRRIGVGTAVFGVANVRESVGKAFDAYTILTSRPASAEEVPATYERLEAEAADLVPLSAAWEQEWAFHLRQGNRDAALSKLAELLRDGTSAHPDIADSSFHYVLLRGARELYESGLIREPDFLEACRIARSLPSVVSLEEKQRTVADFFRSRLKAPEEEQALETRQAVEKAKAYIDAHFCETINLSELAQSSYMSPGYFSSLFRQHTGSNFLEYVTHLRIEHAKGLLAANPERKIGDVALLCGYQDLKYFRKLFKRHTGITPLSFKEDAAR